LDTNVDEGSKVLRKRYLFVGAHIDDVEISAGGWISKLCQDGAEVFTCALSSCEKSLPIGYRAADLIDEGRRAAAILGVQKENQFLGEFEVREFPRDRQSILDYLLELRSKIIPTFVVTHSRFDIHQDHSVVLDECRRAFKGQSLVTYEAPWNCREFSANLFIELPEDNFLKKVSAVMEFHSQSLRRNYGNYVESMAKYRGIQMGTKYAEAYHIEHLISL
jgi:N-acetylglucosamine malate deacetylase 1